MPVRAHVEVHVVIIKRRTTEGTKLIEIITLIQSSVINKQMIAPRTVKSSRKMLWLIGMTDRVIRSGDMRRIMKVGTTSGKENPKSRVIRTTIDTLKIKTITRTDGVNREAASTHKLRMINAARDAQTLETNVRALGTMITVRLTNARRRQTKKNNKRRMATTDRKNSLKAICTKDVGPARRSLSNESQNE